MPPSSFRKEEEIGRLEPEKQADLLILDNPDFRHLSYHFSVNHIWKVIKKGKVVWERTEE